MVSKGQKPPFGQLLKERRLEKKWSQDDLAERTGHIRSKSFISQIESGKYYTQGGERVRPGMEAVDAWAEALGSSKNEFRDSAGYPLIETELTVDEVTKEFSYALAKYKEIPTELRELIRKHISDLVDIFVIVSNQTITDDRASDDIKLGLLDPERAREEKGPKVRLLPREAIPHMDEDEAKEIRRRNNKKSAKSPPKVGAKSGQKATK